jgi:hypothetical protein
MKNDKYTKCLMELQLKEIIEIARQQLENEVLYAEGEEDE